MEFSEETKQYIDALANLLNGQIRGSINKKALEENLELIQMSMATVYEDAFVKGYELGFNNRVSEEIHEQLINDIKDSFKGQPEGGVLNE